MTENHITTKNNFMNEINKETIISINYDIEIDPNLDLNKLKELNNKSSELIYEEKIGESLGILKKLEIILESNAINPKKNLEKKMLLIILHNLACCFQKLKDYDNCINYLDAVIYHYDTSLEKRHNIKIEENYLMQHMNENKSNYQLLGDLILELRFSAKFHIQMSEILSQVNRHVDALKHAKLASLICEDNLIKSNYLYTQIKDNQIKYAMISTKNKNDNNNNNTTNEDDIFINDKIKLNYKLIQELFNIILDIRNSNNKQKFSSISNKVLNHRIESHKENKENKKNMFNSFDNYRESEIKQYKYKNSLLNKVRYIFGSILKPGDWIQIITIDNILLLSPLNSEDLDLDSDSRYELLRDTILEKIVMLTTSYFCVSREMNFLSKDKNNKKTNGAYYLYKAIELSFMFLPVSCPVINFFISNYYKKYGQDMVVIPEGKVIEMNVNLIRNEIEENKDSIYFIGLKKINHKIINNYIENLNDICVCKNENKNSVLIPRLNINNNNNNNDNKANSLNNNINNSVSPNIKLMNSIDVNNNSKINININTNTNTNSNSKGKKSKNDKLNKPKTGDKSKKKSAPQKIKKYKSKPLSNNCTQINNLNISYNSNKPISYFSSYNNNKNNNNNKRRKNKTKSTSKNKNKNDLEAKNKFNNQKKPNLNFNIKNIDLLPSTNFFNFANRSKINEKLAPKFRLNFAKLNFSENESDYSNDNDNAKSNPNINSMNNLMTKFSTTKSNSSSKKNTELNAAKYKKNKLNKKAYSINLNDNFTVYGKGLKTERQQNPKLNVDKNLYNKSGINRTKNMKIFDKKKLNFNLSPKYDYTSILIKKKELKGNQTDRLLNKNKLNIKNNNNNNNKLNNRLNDKINDIKIKFNSPQGRKNISRTYRYFNQDKNSSKKDRNNLTKNNSFKSNFNNKKQHINSIRYQNFKNTKSPKYSQSYYINNTNNSNQYNINCVKDISTIKRMEMIGMFFFNKKKKTYSSENSSFQRPFKNKINLNKHHFNENLVTHFKNMKF